METTAGSEKGFCLIIQDSLLGTIPFLKHSFFTREGGVSTGVYAGLNTGISSRDDRETVLKNRRIALSKLEIPLEALVNCFQVHSNIAVAIPEGGLDEEPQADGMATNVRGVALGIFTADCAPVLFADPKSKVIGAAHAGWRGALSGICESTIIQMEKLGAKRENILVAIGPCIQQKSFEVGEDVRVPCVERDEQNGRFFKESGAKDKFLFDLPAYIKKELEKSKVNEVSVSSDDAYSDALRFYSSRRAQHLKETAFGRMLSVIVLV